MNANPEIVTAAVLVIGDEILSGRTKDKNIGFIADYLTAIGIDLKEVRVISDDEAAIVEAVNALRARYTYLFTTGGIGPTHDDITAECVAKAFGVGISHPSGSGRHPEGAHGQDRRRAQRGAAAHGAHPARRRAGEEQGVGRARLLDRQRDRDGGRAVDHAGDGRRGGAETEDRRQAVVGNHPRRRQGRRRRHRTRRHRQGQSGDDHRQLSVLRREARAQHQYRGALARSAEARDRQGGGRSDAGARCKSQLAAAAR